MSTNSLACEEAPENLVRSILDRLHLQDADGNPLHQSGEPVYVAWCRNAPYGCEQTIKTHVSQIWNISRANEIDPYIVTAQAWHESRFSAFAESEVGARGILQLHPRSRHGRSVRFVRDRRYRDQVCRHRLGHCQKNVVFAAVELLSRSIERCGDLIGGLSMYASGSCERAPNYSRFVLNIRDSLVSE